MIVIVTGSRNYRDWQSLHSTLDVTHASHTIDMLFSGHCKQGADLYAEDWAKLNHIQMVLFPAMWGGGIGAGFERNRVMVSVGWQMNQPRGRVRGLAFASKCVSMKCTRTLAHMSHGTNDCLQRMHDVNMQKKVYKDETLI